MLRTQLIVAGAVAGAAALAWWTALPATAQQGGKQKAAHGPWTVQRAAKVYDQNCSKCHTPVDTKFATDLAWLDQINRTS